MKDDSRRGSDQPHLRRQDDAVLLKKELRRRGLSAADIEKTLRKKRRRKSLEFGLVKSKRTMTPQKAALHLTRTLKPAGRAREVRSVVSGNIVSVSAAASLLNMHPKTVLRFIRTGQLAARRVGKSYRIQRSDLEAFAGIPSTTAEANIARMTSIVDVPNVNVQLARKWSVAVARVIGATARSPATVSVNVVHDPANGHLKIVVVGAADETAEFTTLIRKWLGQLR